MGWRELILEYLRVLISWPVAAVVIAFIFRTALRGLINRVRSVTVTGVQIQVPQLPESTLGGEGNIKPPAPPLPEGLTLTPAQQETLKQAFQAERAAARLWEYRFLNHFLARSTQTVLDWFVGLGQATTFDAYDALWVQFITDTTQRKIILDVLQAHYLVEVDGAILKASEKAKEYVKWRGVLPPLPAATPPALAAP